MRISIIIAVLAALCTAAGSAVAGVDVNVNVRGGIPAPPPPPGLPVPPPPPGVKVKKDQGKHLGQYKEHKGKKHGKNKKH